MALFNHGVAKTMFTLQISIESLTTCPCVSTYIKKNCVFKDQRIVKSLGQKLFQKLSQKQNRLGLFHLEAVWGMIMLFFCIN
jgi:hypothetical protein